MAKQRDTGPKHQAFPELVGKIISSDVKHLSNTILSRLTKEELTSIINILDRTIEPRPGVDTGKAILALAQRDPSPSTVEILSRVLANPEQKAHNRAIAANCLSRMPVKYAEKVLINHLPIQDPLIQNSVIRSLGAIGGPTALRQLMKISRPEPQYLKKQLAFSKALIAYRLGLPEDFLPFKKGKERAAGPEDQLIDLSLRPVTKTKIKKFINALWGSTYNIGLSESFGFELEAGKANWAVLMNKDLQGTKIFTQFSKRKMITGLLARKNKSTNFYAVQYIVLSNPKMKEVEIMVVRTDGEIFYSGKAAVGDGLMNFAMYDIDRQGTAPTNVKGALTRRGIELHLKVPFGKRINKQHGEEIVI